MAITNAKIIEYYKAENNIPMDKPLFTYAVWKSMGYQVKRGEASRHRVQLWKYTPGKKTTDAEAQEAPQGKGNRCFMKTMCLFEAEQVERMC